jgi:hypothetical protein
MNWGQNTCRLIVLFCEPLRWNVCIETKLCVVTGCGLAQPTPATEAKAETNTATSAGGDAHQWRIIDILSAQLQGSITCV